MSDYEVKTHRRYIRDTIALVCAGGMLSSLIVGVFVAQSWPLWIFGGFSVLGLIITMWGKHD